MLECLQMSNYNVVNDPNGGWNVKQDGAERSSFHSMTQEEAEAKAKRLAGNSGGGEVRIQGLDGKFRDSDTVPHSNDPFPPRDKNF